MITKPEMFDEVRHETVYQTSQGIIKAIEIRLKQYLLDKGYEEVSNPVVLFLFPVDVAEQLEGAAVNVYLSTTQSKFREDVHKLVQEEYEKFYKSIRIETIGATEAMVSMYQPKGQLQSVKVTLSF